MPVSDPNTTGRTLAALLRASRTTHLILCDHQEELWRAAALSRFPRLVKILVASGRAPSSFRALYADQLRAESREMPAADAHGEPELSDFVFTVEVRFDGNLAGSWTGKVENPDELSGSPVVRVWEHEPEWFASLLAEPLPVAAAGCTCTAYLTHELRTTCIYHNTPW